MAIVANPNTIYNPRTSGYQDIVERLRNEDVSKLGMPNIHSSSFNYYGGYYPEEIGNADFLVNNQNQPINVSGQYSPPASVPYDVTKSGGQIKKTDSSQKTSQETSPDSTAKYAQIAQTLQNNGSTQDIAGSGLMSAGVMSGNPYLLAAGVGLKAMSAAQEREDQQRLNEYNAAISERDKMSNAYSNLANIYRTLKV